MLPAFASFIACACFAQDGIANLVQNPSFEELAPDGKPLNWIGAVRKHEQDPNKQAAAEFKLTDDAQDGKTAAAIIAPESNPDRSLNTAEWRQTVKVKPNQRYFFSVWMKAKLRCGWPNATIEQLSSAGEYFKSLPKDTKFLAELSGEETRGGDNLHELQFQTGPDTGLAVISLRFQDMGAGVVSFDNVSLIELAR